uniref:Uncharacterized protein n=1 Tax=Romanomermis culicivorax TaxID=13658 RepID=A0A915I184_ROMCU
MKKTTTKKNRGAVFVELLKGTRKLVPGQKYGDPYNYEMASNRTEKFWQCRLMASHMDDDFWGRVPIALPPRLDLRQKVFNKMSATFQTKCLHAKYLLYNAYNIPSKTSPTRYL